MAARWGLWGGLAVFVAMGGTAVGARNAFALAWNAAEPAFHATPAGGPVAASGCPHGLGRLLIGVSEIHQSSVRPLK